MEKPSNLIKIFQSKELSSGGGLLNYRADIYRDSETGETYVSVVVGPVGHPFRPNPPHPLIAEYGGKEAITMKIAEVLQQQYFGVTAEEGYEFKGVFPFEPDESESIFKGKGAEILYKLNPEVLDVSDIEFTDDVHKNYKPIVDKNSAYADLISKLATGYAFAGASAPRGNNIHEWTATIRAQMLREAAPRSFMEIAALEEGVMRGARRRFIMVLNNFPELVSQVEGLGNNSFTYQGHGRSGAFFKEENNGIVLGLRDHIPPRVPIPHHLQALSGIEGEGIGIELTPALNTSDVTPEHVEQLRNAIENYVGPNGERYQFNDPEQRNVGLAPDGTPYVLDGDAITVYQSHMPPKPRISEDNKPWVNDDCTWKQYTDFQGLHEQHESSLHQNGGVLTPEPSVELQQDAPVVPEQEKLSVEPFDETEKKPSGSVSAMPDELDEPALASGSGEKEASEPAVSGEGKDGTPRSVDPVAVGAGVVAAGSGLAAVASLKGGNEPDGQSRIKVVSVFAAALAITALSVVADRMFNSGKATNWATRIFSGRGGNDAQRSV